MPVFALNAPVILSHTTILFEFAPSFHGNLATVKFTFIFNTRLLRFLACRLTGISPGVVEFPERVEW
jgi:hypothetical protein